jgi:hypothetical protein
MLRTIHPIKHEFIYIEGDEVKCLYFNAMGQCGFILPKFNNVSYVTIEKAKHFGLDDITGSIYD